MGNGTSTPIQLDTTIFNKSTTAEQAIRGRDLTGKTILITGANAGIGFETAKTLYRHNAHIIVASRNLEKTNTAMQRIESEKSNGKITVLQLNLSSFKDVYRFVDELKQRNLLNLDIIILNAGMVASKFELTEDGFESTCHANHLGNFLLLQQLLPYLKEHAKTITEKVRIVVLSSEAYKGCKDASIVRNALKDEKNFSLFSNYSVSKYYNVAMTIALDKKLKEAGIENITVNALMPGVIKTDILSNANKWLARIFYMFTYFVSKTAEQGAATTITVATAPELENYSGLYFNDCQIANYNGLALNSQLIEEVWQLSEESIGQKYSF